MASVKRIGSTIMKNAEALSSLLAWSRGSFSLEKMASIPTEREIQIPTEVFLQEAASHVGEHVIL